jgi:hypothetical protein
MIHTFPCFQTPVPKLWLQKRSAGFDGSAPQLTAGPKLLAAEIAATRPLAVVMAEKVHALRQWARDRTVAAD